MLGLVGAGLTGCESRQPSILLFVSDTTRADAVSAASAPTVEALAADGVRYRRAFSHAPWTLPSHVSLFSGTLPTQHGVGARSVHAPESLEMLAERLRANGYQTIGLSENPWISSDFNLDQGFDEFAFIRRTSHDRFRSRLEEALAEVDRDRPVFLFVNVMDAHEPYRHVEGDPFAPPSLSPEATNSAARRAEQSMCQADADLRDQAVAWSLYLGGLSRADRKLATTIDALQARDPSRELISIFTSDHGQHFGEHGLTNHLFSVHQELLHVPLVVHGAPRSDPAEIDEPVALGDLADTIVGWAGGGREPLPTRSEAGVVSELTEFETLGAHAPAVAIMARARGPCDRSVPVFGDMRSLIHYPLKLMWFSDYPPALYDLSADPTESNDLSARRPEDARRLMGELELRTESLARIDATSSPAKGPSDEVLQRLRELGYLETPEPTAVRP